MILADNGGSINTFSLRPTKKRTKLYSGYAIKERIKKIQNQKMKYEKLFNLSEIEQLPLKRLLFSASLNAIKKSEVDNDYYFCINLPSEEIALINANKNTKEKIKYLTKNSVLPIPRSEIVIDPRLLFGLLTHIYHWNNAEVGSQFLVRRYPNVFNRKAQSFLNFLTV